MIDALKLEALSYSKYEYIKKYNGYFIGFFNDYILLLKQKIAVTLSIYDINKYKLLISTKKELLEILKYKDLSWNPDFNFWISDLNIKCIYEFDIKEKIECDYDYHYEHTYKNIFLIIRIFNTD